MLTLMSKPVRRWEVLLGKYLGIVLATLLAVAVLGGVLMIATYLRIPEDYLIRSRTLDDRELFNLAGYRKMHLAGLIPSLLMVWMQISVLAAIGVALSTRFSLVVNLPAVILIYIAGNLTRFLYPLDSSSKIAKAFAAIVSTVLPYLAVFDQREKTVYQKIAISNTQFASQPDAVQYSTIWNLVGLAAIYALAYATFALAAGLWSFRTRELGGAEG
jgi:ABC-type transport system involved in multi-copper enzyme maturation permease subunit